MDRPSSSVPVSSSALGKRRAEQVRARASREDESSSFSSTITASAAPRLQSQRDANRLTSPRMTRSHDGFDLEDRDEYDPNTYHRSTARPLGGTNKRFLMEQIRELQHQVKELQQRLSKARGGAPNPSSVLAEYAGGIKSHSNSSMLASTSKDKAPAAQVSSLSKQKAEEPVAFPSTFASSYQDPSGKDAGYLEEVVILAGNMRRALLREAGGAKRSPEEEEFDSSALTSTLRQMLLEATPHPENAESYATAFATRSLELYKDPKDRNSIMQPGPLQKTALHPLYIDILMQCIREPIIAHMGSFEELDFCIWLVTEVTYHTEDLEDSTTTDQEPLDDTRYEFSGKFIAHYPNVIDFGEWFPNLGELPYSFIGTKQVLQNTNRWRAARGEELIEQTEEMIRAESFTRSQQKRSFSQE